MDLLKIKDFVDSVPATRLHEYQKCPIDTMLYKCYNVLDACTLFKGNKDAYKRATHKISGKYTKDDVLSLGLYIPELDSDYDFYVTKLDNVICFYAHTTFDLTGYKVLSDVEDLLPIARGKDLQSLYECRYDRQTSKLHFTVAQFCLEAPEITSYLIDWGILDINPKYFKLMYNIIMQAAQNRFQCETAESWEFEEKD